MALDAATRASLARVENAAANEPDRVVTVTVEGGSQQVTLLRFAQSMRSQVDEELVGGGLDDGDRFALTEVEAQLAERKMSWGWIAFGVGAVIGGTWVAWRLVKGNG